ncbi:MAG TPA: DNA repair protein RecN [Dinghuibacter sp.]|jgi:DNA repair protein RecN (Recombination protein N)|uniref:DNA repair protein RecN n=1 Tax=Dinghuibacter sp. TaxID=2024697 RepID=UPI002B769CFC|nr:DNA repair protein RecN [Dinghuibacter sp.]HTJ13545.1 DNA repair protein RecN [Dinghuibacter sp.]
MLAQLHIQNYAIIDDLTIDFGKGLNIITGETGAGKSILMGALGLILGDRADSAVLVEKDKKCVIEGVFSTKIAAVARFLEGNDLDQQDQLLVRREITAAGKSRAFINDTPAPISQLQELAAMLVDLHQQFDTLELGKAEFQREVVDALAQTGPMLQQYQQEYRQAQAAGQKATALRAQAESLAKEGDYNRFLLEELSDAAFREQEVEDMEAELKLLENSEGIKSALTSVTYALSDGEQPMVRQLKSLLHQLQGYTGLLQGLPQLVERLNSVQIELQDVAAELEALHEQVNYDPERATALQERLSLGYRLFKKHGVRDTDALLRLQAGIAAKLEGVVHLDEQIAELERLQEKHTRAATTLAADLSTRRKAVLGSLEQNINAILIRVGMPNARLKVQCKDGPLGPYGADYIEFLFDANKSNRFEPIRKVASGGELSRLMLAIKSQVAGSMQMPTLIFDEIDTGISGEAARQVGIIMKELGAAHQVICITHQPQIAAKADAHYFVYKTEEGDRIRTRIRQLKEKERVEAIARMLSGEQFSDGTLKVAREMILN